MGFLGNYYNIAFIAISLECNQLTDYIINIDMERGSDKKLKQDFLWQ